MANNSTANKPLAAPDRCKAWLVLFDTWLDGLLEEAGSS